MRDESASMGPPTVVDGEGLHYFINYFEYLHIRIRAPWCKGNTNQCS